MVSPTIHLNGTSREALLEALLNASSVIINAQAALAETVPNARDYYPQGSDAYRRAVEEHQARIDKLRDVRHELEQVAEAILAQGDR